MIDQLTQKADAEDIIHAILVENPELVKQYSVDQLLGFNSLFRKAMGRAKAKVNPKILGSVLFKQLEDLKNDVTR